MQYSNDSESLIQGMRIMRSYRQHSSSISSPTAGHRSRARNIQDENNVHSMGVISIVGPDEHGQRMLRSAAMSRQHDENQIIHGGGHLITLPRQPASFHNAKRRRRNGTAFSILLCFNILFAVSRVTIIFLIFEP